MIILYIDYYCIRERILILEKYPRSYINYVAHTYKGNYVEKRITEEQKNILKKKGIKKIHWTDAINLELKYSKL